MTQLCKPFATSNSFEKKANLFILIAILMSSAMIVCAALGDLWLDEIWSLFMAESVRAPWEIMSLKHDNNHLLNTLYLYLIGQQENFIIYRMLSVVSGVLSLLILQGIAKKWGSLERILVVVFAGLSYPLLLYFSEARGYAPAILFAVAALYMLEKYQRKPGVVSLVLFWLAAILGILSHLSFIIILISLTVSIVFSEIRSGHSFRVTNIIQLLGLPFLSFIPLYIFFARNIVIGGGPVLDIPSEAGKGIMYLTGLPDGMLFFAFPLALMVVASGVYFSIRLKETSWIFYASVTLAAPLAVLLLTRPSYFYFRYMVVCFPFFYLWAAYVLGRGFRINKYVRFLVAAVVLAYVAGQAQRIVPFVELGRGNYREALAEMAQRTPGNIITIGSDHDFRNKMLVSFYSRFLPESKRVVYIDRPDWNAAAPEWIIIHSTEPEYQPLPRITLGDRYFSLKISEKFYRNSGFSWFLYRREET